MQKEMPQMPINSESYAEDFSRSSIKESNRPNTGARGSDARRGFSQRWRDRDTAIGERARTGPSGPAKKAIDKSSRYAAGLTTPEPYARRTGDCAGSRPRVFPEVSGTRGRAKKSRKEKAGAATFPGGQVQPQTSGGPGLPTSLDTSEQLTKLSHRGSWNPIQFALEASRAKG